MRLLGLLGAPRSQLVGAAAILFVWSCAGTSPDVAQQFKRYAEAGASHDLETLEMEEFGVAPSAPPPEVQAAGVSWRAVLFWSLLALLVYVLTTRS
jgi:hypothetical protein